MLRELITWVLNTYLGKYLENFNPAQLTVALLSGEVELENVPLRKDAFRGLGLPIQVLSGSIGKIKLQVPVRAFRTAPWCISIEKVYIIVGPINLEEWDDEKEEQADIAYKLAMLDEIEAKWRAQLEANIDSGYYASSYSGWLSYGSSLATNILENLQLKINDVHIRYEDSICIPNKVFACGLTIGSLTAHSCDSKWILGAANNDQNASFKLVELQSMAFYWNRITNSQSLFGKVPSIELAKALQKNCILAEQKYIINPVSAQAHFKRDRSETPLRTRSRPRLSCEVTVSEIYFTLSDLQYSEMIECVRSLDDLAKFRRYRLLRPRSTVANGAKLWWKYAAKCHGFYYESVEDKWQIVHDNIHYIKICLRLFLNPNENLTPDDKHFKTEIEKRRDFDDLRSLREISLMCTPMDQQKKNQGDSQGRNMLFQWFPQWMGWYGGSAPANADSEQTTPTTSLESSNQQTTFEDEILNALASSSSGENSSLLKRDAVFGKFDFILKNGVLNICSENNSTQKLNTMMEFLFDGLVLNIETRPRSGSHFVGLALGAVNVKDRITLNSQFPDLIKPQLKDDTLHSYSRILPVQKLKKETLKGQREEYEPLFQLEYERKPLAHNTDYRLAVKTKSLDVVYNIGALKWVIDFVSRPLHVMSARQKLQAMKNRTKMKLIKNWKNILDGDLGQRKSWALEIDISAPQIIFVEDITNKNTSVVLVDFGRFQLQKNATERQLNKQKTDVSDRQMSFSSSKFSNMDSEDDEAFMTPCSTPPGSHNSPSDSPTLISAVSEITEAVINSNTDLEDAFHNRLYDKYTIDLTDLQVLVCKGSERWTFASTKGTSSLHVLDRFNISLQIERRVVHTIDPQYPSVTLYGTLPKLVAHLNEHKILALKDIVDIITNETNHKSQDLPQDISLNPSDVVDGEDLVIDYAAEQVDDDQQNGELSNLVVLQFVIDQMSLEVQSRGRSIAELQVTGVRAGLSKRSIDTNISLSVHGLLLVDAIQSFGPDFELLIASHRHVGMDSASGSLRHSEPCSPTSPGSPDPMIDRRPTSPQTITHAISTLQKANSATWSTVDDLDALITVEINLISSEKSGEELHIANIHFNNLDIIANQETIVELLGFLKRVFPTRTTSNSDANLKPPDRSNFNEKHKMQTNSENQQNNIADIRTRTEITFDFNRLNILILRALMRDTFLVGRKVGTFTMSEARVHATVGKELSVEGSLGGLQVLDLTPEGVNHQRILSVGKDPLTESPEIVEDMLSTLTQEVYGSGQSKNDLVCDQWQALSFSVSRNIEATVSIKIRMASVWYTHCARFVQELSWCASEFKHYLKTFARSLREKATGMAFVLVQPFDLSSQEENLKYDGRYSFSTTFDRSGKKKYSGKKINIKLDIILDTPVLVVPRSSSSPQVLVAHLGKISVTNTQNFPSSKEGANDDRRIFTIDEDLLSVGGNEFQMDDEAELGRNESVHQSFDLGDERAQESDIYSIDVRNVNLFSLDTSRRKIFRLSALPRAEDFYSCKQDAVPILHDTAIGLKIVKITEFYNQPSEPSYEFKNILEITGSVTQPLQLSLSRHQYEQLLDTINNIFRVPADLVRPPAEVETKNCNKSANVDTDPIETTSAFDLPQSKLNENLNPQSSFDTKRTLEPKVLFTLPTFIVQLKDEQNTPLIEISFRDFDFRYEKHNKYETNIQVSLRSILMEDLLCSIDSKHRQMVVSSPHDTLPARPGTSFSSNSCPNLVRLQSKENAMSGSLPDNLEMSAGFERIPQSYNPHSAYQKPYQMTSLCPDTPPPSPLLRNTDEDNLVIYSAVIVDPESPNFHTMYGSLTQTSSIDFNCLDLIVSVERWFLLLNFFGLMSVDEGETTYSRQERDQPAVEEKAGENTELKILVRSLTLVLVRNESELAKANVSNAWFVVAKHNTFKAVEGRLGSVSLYDLTSYGGIYRERFLTSGNEALKFIYRRDSEKNNRRTLNKDAKLQIQMASVKYVHTKRFVMEIFEFFKEFLQLQTPVMRKITSSDIRHNYQQRPTQLGLEINAGSPIILLPLSYQSDQVIVADLGEFSLRNSFHLASEQDVISLKSDSAKLDEILDVMQVDLVNTDLFTGCRWSKVRDISNIADSNTICLDMGSYWIMAKGTSMLNKKCHLKLQIERNMDSWKSHNCPDISVQGTLSRLEGIIDIEQYKLIRGFLAYNLGEPIDDIYMNAFSVAESRVNLTANEYERPHEKLIWTNLSINLNLENVSVILNWLVDDPSRPEQISEFPISVQQSLACINFIKSNLKIDSFSDGSQDIDLVSQEILIKDSRYVNEKSPKNVFPNILQPIHVRPGTDLVQAEVHSRKRIDSMKYTILLNNMRLMAILDWLENVQDYLTQNAEQPKAEYFTQQAMDASNSLAVPYSDYTPIELILNITDSELVFVEKTNQVDTNAVILKSTTVVSYRPMEPIKLMSINLNNLEVFSCILGYEDETALSIIDPITINLDVKRHTLQIQLQRQLCIRLSYHDVKMFNRMIQSLPKQTRKAQTKENRKSSLENAFNIFSIAQLAALGFQEKDCRDALESCNYQLDEAALWLTQNAQATRLFATKNQSVAGLEIRAVEIKAHCISICVIDDCKDADVPLLELSLSELDFRQELNRVQPLGLPGAGTSFSSGHLRGIVASDYYNRHLSGWEPMIESWRCFANWNYSLGQSETADRSRLSLKIIGEDLLKFNATSTLCELWQIVRANWTQDYYEGTNVLVNTSSNGQSPCGYRLRSPFVPFSLRNDTGVRLWFKILVTSPGGITTTEVSRDCVRSQWVLVQPNISVPFSFGEQNKLRHMDSHKLNLHQVVVRVDGWAEVGPVSVDKVGTFFRHAHRETLTNFPMMPKARIVFAVTLEGSAQKLVTIRSALRLKNKLDDIIILKMEHPFKFLGISDWPDAITSILNPGQSYSIPLTHVHASLFFRPLPSLAKTLDEQNGNTHPTIKQANSSNSLFNGNDYWNTERSPSSLSNGGQHFQFCDPSIQWRECTEGTELLQEIRSCKSNRLTVFNVVAVVRREPYPAKEANILPGHSIVLLPPLRLHNLLCCDLLYKLPSGTQGRIQSSKTANIFEFNLNEVLELAITLDGYCGTGQISVPAGFIGQADPRTRLVDTNNRDLILRAGINSTRGNGMEISISAPYWLVNRTGLPLIFKQEGVSHEASGQFSEHEQARLVSPLMFSFTEPDDRPSIAIRLGNRFGNNPPWCQALRLNEDIIHRQLRSQGHETFFIGIEIRRGRGRYSRTSIITFSPCFQLYNRSSYKLQFAQKCYATMAMDNEARSTIIDAVPGCHLPFHWPRLDKSQFLCVRLPDVEECLWSGAIPIDQAQSLYINIRNIHGDMHFLRLEVILQGATYFLLFGDAHALPPPIRLDNFSEVPITFFQPGGKHQWRTLVKAHSSKAYSLDEPMGSTYLQVEAPGGVAHNYSLTELECSHNLTYENFIYIAFKGTFHNPATTENLHKSLEFDIESQHLVLGVRDNRVIFMRKRPGDRAELWRMNQEKQLEHEGSSPPTEPGKGASKISPRLVLDLERAPQPMNYTSLVVRPANRQRRSTQTWRFTEDGRLMCEHANLCVQARDGIFGLRPGCEAVLGMIASETHVYVDSKVPIEQYVERQKLRPGSGCLSVTASMDGPITTLQIKDVNSPSNAPLAPDPAWQHASHIIKEFTPYRPNNYENSRLAEECHVNMILEHGLSISVISKYPCEELALITLQKISLEAVSTPNVRTIDVTVGDMQIDNQLFETPCPVLMYTLRPSAYDSSERHSLCALQFNAEMLPTPNENAVIFKRMQLHLWPFVLYLEERLILRLAVFLGLGKSDQSATSLVDETEYEAQQVASKILAANAKRYYFGDLQIMPSQIRLSALTASKLSPQFAEIKKRLGLTLIKFEDAHINFDRFSDKHHFETQEVYLRAIKSHYKKQLKRQAARILGSVTFLGNPLGFANDVSEGVNSLLNDGSVMNLFQNVTHGISNSTAKLTETISDGLGRVVLDEQDNETRQRILEVPSGHNTSGEHLAAGLKGFGFGILGGVTSIVKHTYEGAQSDGFQGFLSGLGKGIVGTVTKPLIGVLDLTSETANAVRETSKSSHRVLPERKRLPRCISGAPGGLLPSYSFTESKGQQLLFLINKRDFNEQFMSYEPHLFDEHGSKLRLLVSSEHVWVFSRTNDTTTIILSYHLSELVSCHPVSVNSTADGHKLKKPKFYIELCLTLTAKSAVTNTAGQEVVKRPRVRCQTEEISHKASRHINYAKSVYDERIHTLNCDLILNA